MHGIHGPGDRLRRGAHDGQCSGVCHGYGPTRSALPGPLYPRGPQSEGLKVLPSACLYVSVPCDTFSAWKYWSFPLPGRACSWISGRDLRASLSGKTMWAKLCPCMLAPWKTKRASLYSLSSKYSPSVRSHLYVTRLNVKVRVAKS